MNIYLAKLKISPKAPEVSETCPNGSRQPYHVQIFTRNARMSLSCQDYGDGVQKPKPLWHDNRLTHFNSERNDRTKFSKKFTHIQLLLFSYGDPFICIEHTSQWSFPCAQIFPKMQFQVRKELPSKIPIPTPRNSSPSAMATHTWAKFEQDSACKHAQISFLEAKYGDANKLHGSRGVLYSPRDVCGVLQRKVTMFCRTICLQRENLLRFVEGRGKNFGGLGLLVKCHDLLITICSPMTLWWTRGGFLLAKASMHSQVGLLFDPFNLLEYPTIVKLTSMMAVD